MKLRSFFFAFALFALIVSFQNCSPQAGFTTVALSENSLTSGQGDPSSPEPAPVPTGQTQILKLANPNLSAQPGQSLNLTTQFNAVPMAKDYMVFIHFVDANGSAISLSGDYSPDVPTTQWSGSVRHDRLVTIPSALPSGQFSIRMGLYENVQPYMNRAALEMGPGVTVDQENRYTVGTLTVSSSPTPPPGPPPSGSPEVQFFGRFDTSDSAGPRYTWSGSSMSARFKGTSVSVTLNEGNTSVYYAYVIDDQPAKRFATSSGVKTYALASHLASGDHQVLLMRDSEGNEGVSQFRGFSFAGGELLSPPTFSGKYRLEVIGDSNTAGYGDLGADPCKFSTATESAYYAYPQQTALLLGSEPARNISYSGIGIYRNWGKSGPESGFPAMPGFYPRTLTDVGGTQGAFSNDPQKQPNVVVINLGSNDFWNGSGPSQTDFVNAYKGFVQTVRSHYPNAYLLAALPNGSEAKDFVLAAINQVKASGEKKIQFVELPLHSSPTGCNGHPTQTTQLNTANVLANAIRGLGL